MDGKMQPEPEIRLRSYQHEMLDASLRRNVIVAMDTGSGKTHVAIARIRYVLETKQPGKRAWFMSPSVALSNQQYQVIQEHLAAFRIITLTGADGVDKWTDQRLWDATLLGVDVVVGTPAVLADALTHGFVRMDELSLLVFDEAHRCIKNSPMNNIMKNFYHPDKAQSKHVPHILGLSASPVMGSKQGSLEQLEANLDAVVITPSIERASLQRHVHPPKILISTFESSLEFDIPSASPLCDALAIAAKEYDFNTDPYVLELKQAGDDRSQARLDKLRQSLKTYCSDELRALSRRVIMLYEQLGLTSAEWYLCTYVERFRKGLQGIGIMPDLVLREQHHLMTILDSVAPQGLRGGISTGPSTTVKFQQLLSLLNQQAGPMRRGIIFVEQRATVSALIHLLDIYTVPYNVGGFVGTSTNKARKMSLADLAEGKVYEADLNEFRSGTKNLIIATNVLEEGIDVSACNLVICFDLPKNLVSFVQRRGRARQKDSTYCLFIASDDTKSDPGKWQTLEAKMKEAYMAERLDPEQSEEDEDATDARIYRVQSTNALLTLENAKTHLYHFCAVSTVEVSKYVDLRPEFATLESGGPFPWTATVTLPPLIHSDFKAAASSRAWNLEDTAIKDAAYEAYIALHKAGLVNDNLLPLVKDYAPQAGEHIDQPSILTVSERQSSWDVLTASHGSWHPLEVTICGAGRCWTARMLIPMSWSHREVFTLYWNESTDYQITLAPARDPENRAMSGSLRQATGNLLRSVHGDRIPSDSNDLLFAIADSDIAPSSKHGEKVVLRVKSRGGRLFVADGCTLEAAGGPIIVKAFPKRKDFLHPLTGVSNSAAYTAEQLFPPDECYLENKVSFESAVLAAFIPSILYRIDSSLSARRLQTTVLRDVGIHRVELILEAISAPAANENADYNRLEYLGDAILKFCASLQVMSQHLTWPEGYLTVEKLRIVRNSTLTKAALVCGLDKYILSKPFTGAKWWPPRLSDYEGANGNSRTRQMSSKVLADVVEALIGAAYVDEGLDKAYSCIKSLLPEENWYDNPVEGLTIDLSPSTVMALGPLEDLVGHHFKHTQLLVEAVTHASLPFSTSGMSYERLEFLGDAVLDLIIVPKLYAYSKRSLKHHQMHTMHEALVNGQFLGYCCMSYSLPEVVQSHELGKYEKAQGTRRLHLHDFIRAGPELIRDKQVYLQRYNETHEDIAERLQVGATYPWLELTALNPPKFFSDLVESVLGAIYVDTNGDLGACELFVKRLGILDVMNRLLGDDVQAMSPKELVGIAAGNEQFRYKNSSRTYEDGRREYSSIILVGEEEVARAEGCGSKAEAEVKTAICAVGIMRARVGHSGQERERKADRDAGDGDEASNC
ncbi:P-loop containing nucleoside triphosphate hydrolase protein [Teratosphaeria nubilosa]|uniref:P-loop containing nucleoside triphosphate hydrolase protein n=1 Tax=Teratosphaeria nubilosa TaxID=161662 RepID=A0A6G1L0C3_9PEZI|nr:P-loop containing nucleoside triphosphate hydrolase protein [Teratosphaeria nubilosa]